MRLPIESLLNLFQWLREVGVTTKAGLERRASVVAYRLMKQLHPKDKSQFTLGEG